jgi:VIT1/CCC1 family predicted Fe2+/Mn2+ transporter
MSTRTPTFARMLRTFPLRTGVFTVGPVAVGVAQLLNVALHGTAVWVAVVAAAIMCVFSVLITGYHLARFRRQSLSADVHLEA